MNKDTGQVPMPPTDKKTVLYKSISFWSSILVTLDRKIQTLSEQMGYGKIGLTVHIHKGKIQKVSWNDEVYDNDLVSKAGEVNSYIHEEMIEDKRVQDEKSA